MITIGWQCNRCKKRAKAFVPNRPEGMDIKVWVDECAQAAGDAHSLLSPGCPERKLDILMPVPETARYIGEKDNPKPLSDDLSEFDKKFKRPD